MISAVSELVVASMKLAELPLRMASIGLELLTFGMNERRATTAHVEDQQTRAVATDRQDRLDLQIEAAARIIKIKLTAGRDLGFACSMRANFPDDVIREIAAEALKAARRQD